LFAKLEAGLKKEKVFIEVVGGTPDDVATAAGDRG